MHVYHLMRTVNGCGNRRLLQRGSQRKRELDATRPTTTANNIKEGQWPRDMRYSFLFLYFMHDNMQN